MTPVRAPRWALSFADLCLLLLGFFVILHARGADSRALAGGLRAAFGDSDAPVAAGADYRAAALFHKGEAVMLPASHAELAAFGRRAATAGKAVRIESRGTDGGARRFDDWELGAARVAAVARAVRSGGLAEGRISISVAEQPKNERPEGQRIRLSQTAS